MDLAGAILPEQPESGRRFHRPGSFEIDPRARREHARQAIESRWQGILPERRVEENHVEALTRALQVVEGVGEDEIDSCCAELPLCILQRLERLFRLLDHDNARGAARGRLEAQGAAAGEKVEATKPVEPLSQPIEERLAHPVGGGAQAGEIGNRDAPTAIFTGDDSDLPFGRLH